MSIRHTFEYPIPDGFENARTFILATHIFQRTKSGYVIVIYKVLDSLDIFHKSENLKYLYFEETEKRDMLNYMIHETQICKINGWDYAVYKYEKDLTKIYGVVPEEKQEDLISALRIRDLTPGFGDILDQAKRIKDLL